jgi:hypothetical protein
MNFPRIRHPIIPDIPCNEPQMHDLGIHCTLRLLLAKANMAHPGVEESSCARPSRRGLCLHARRRSLELAWYDVVGISRPPQPAHELDIPRHPTPQQRSIQQLASIHLQSQLNFIPTQWHLKVLSPDPSAESAPHLIQSISRLDVSMLTHMPSRRPSIPRT